MKFKVGDRVRCINVRPLGPNSEHLSVPPLRVGSIYTVNAICNCSECGRLKLDVGISIDYGTVCMCGEIFYSCVWWFDSSRFVKEVEQVRYVAVPCEVKIDQLVEN